VHCTAFRRLEYKTQVFVNHEGDLFRTRLTHSIEVAQITRSIARALHLNEDLAEAVALSHDLGHTPFGHAGQEALNTCMKDFGGFEHNLQSLRTVDLLEESYAEFNGLNLLHETREGILKHCSHKNAEGLGEIGRRFLEGHQPSLEAQLANLADEIAYNNHDIDDGLRSGLITLEQLDAVPIFLRKRQIVERAYPGLAGRRLIHETIRRMINLMAVDLIDRTRTNIVEAQVGSLDDVRVAPRLVAYSAELLPELRVLKGLSARKPVSPLPGSAHDRQGPAHHSGSVRRVHERPAFAAAPVPADGQKRQTAGHCRLYRRNDRSIRDAEHRRLYAVGEIY
jgi:dGTPase